jgi:hypothetical protein
MLGAMGKFDHICTALSMLAFASTASAQENSPLSVHFHQYSQAFQRGDFAAAETAASAALSDSEAQDGQGGHTPVLAFNLARVRVVLGKWREASEPARQAYDLSRTSSATGVDQDMSALLWGRVRLALEGAHGAEFLMGLLDHTVARADLMGDRYDAADDLGLWAMQNSDYLIAIHAWVREGEVAQGAPVDVRFARGRARAYEAIAIASESLARDISIDATTAHEVRARLAEAYSLVRPFAFSPAPDARVPTTQEVYAEVLAWDRAVWSKLSSDDESRRADAVLEANPVQLNGKRVCALHAGNGNRHVDYPFRPGTEGQLGAVVVRLRFDDRGAYRGADVAAYVGDQGFAHAAAAAAATWTYTVEITPACSPAPVLYVPVTFTMGDY